MEDDERMDEDELLNFAMPYDETVGRVWPEALRFVLDRGQAHRNCKRRACVAVKSCQMRPKMDVRLNCGGSVVSDEMVEEAACLALFATMAAASNCFAVSAARERGTE